MEGPSNSMVVNEGDDVMDLPPGFRFHPTDEEIITSYLVEKVLNNSFVARAIGEVDLNKSEPWDLPKKAKMGEKEWFFFCQRDRKYPTGMRTNRATESGYWKATGKDKEIYKGKNCLVGMKKTLVFYRGRAPRGEKTNWVMHEYRLEGKLSYNTFPKSSKNEWVVSRVFHKNNAGSLKRINNPGLMRMDSFVNDLLDSSSSLPPLTDFQYSQEKLQPADSSFTDNDDFKETGATSLARSPTNGSCNFLSNFTTTTTSSYHQPQDHKKGLFVSPNSDSNYYPMINPAFYPQINSSLLPAAPLPHSSCFFSCSQVSPCINGPIQNYNPIGSIFTTSLFHGNLRTGMAAENQCKMEQTFSPNQSKVCSQSEDTGHSSDFPAETYYADVSKQDFGNRPAFEDLTVDPNAPDMDSLWDY